MQPLRLSVIWHMHQPSYRDAYSGEYVMPWVLLHGLTYLQMAELNETHNVTTVHNFSPVLLEQLEDYSNNSVEELARKDVFVRAALKDPKDLTKGEREFIYRNFTVSNRLAERSPRYMELRRKVEEGGSLDDHEMFDLQTLFFLIWFTPSVLRRDSEIKDLFNKGRDFNLSDKHLVLKRLTFYISEIIPLLKRLQEEGRLEITASPFYHSHLPMIHNSNVISVNMPNSPAPSPPFQHPEDVVAQVRMALEYMADKFGIKPSGMWPSEGSVSGDIIPAIAGEGISWIASGESVLKNSLNLSRSRPTFWPLAGYEYSPWKVMQQGQSIFMIFRNEQISNHISFDYKNMDHSVAVNHLMMQLRNLWEASEAERATNPNFPLGDRPVFVSVILDGENPWEHYRNNGQDFLDEMFRMLEQERWISPTTPTRYLNEFGCPETNILTTLFPGSWATGGSFSIWGGSPETNTAWGYLAMARQVVESCGNMPEEKKKEIMRLMYQAEGSDSFWWLGGMPTRHLPIFDLHFRRLLKRIYELAGREAPQYLDRPISSGFRGNNSDIGTMHR